MKINETISRIESTSKSVFAWKSGNYIHVAFNTFTILIIPYDAQTFFDVHFLNPDLKLPADVKERLAGIVGKFLRTPVKERFPEKKYRLRWFDDNVGESFLGLYRKTIDRFDPYWFVYGEPNPDAIFTESELEQLKKDNPHLAPAIDAMKEPVEDKDE